MPLQATMLLLRLQYPTFLNSSTRITGRLLTCSGGMAATFRFQPNEFSTYNRQVHFSPIWFPDHTSYTVYTYVIDAWTPAGMLSLNLNDSVQIDGSLYDDWYSKRE